MRWITLLFWNTLPNQSSDQHVFLFVHTKEEAEQLLVCFGSVSIFVAQHEINVEVRGRPK